MSKKRLHSHVHVGDSRYLIDGHYNLNLAKILDADILRFTPNYLAWIANEHARERRAPDAADVARLALATINSHPISLQRIGGTMNALVASSRLVEQTIAVLARHEAELPAPVRDWRQKLELEMAYLNRDRAPA